MEAVVRSCSPKKVLLILLQNSKGNIFAGVSFFFKKKTLKYEKRKVIAQVLSRKFCKIYQNTKF